MSVLMVNYTATRPHYISVWVPFLSLQ